MDKELIDDIVDDQIIGAVEGITEGLVDLINDKLNLAYEQIRRDISEKYQNQLALFARDYLGRKYGYFKIILHAGDWILSEITRKEKYFFRKLAKNNNYPICSWLVAHCFKKIGLYFGINPNYCQPDDIYDFCLRNEDLYKLIYKKVLGSKKRL